MKNQKIEKTGRKGRFAHEAEAAGSGAIAGALFGSIAGPPGMMVGAVLGGAVGGVAAAVLENEGDKKLERTRELDEEIGIIEGDIGASNLEHPPSRMGLFSAGSMGVERATTEPDAEGPIQPL